MNAVTDSLNGKICILCCDMNGGKLLMCSNCNLCVHERCNGGIYSDDSNETWSCEPCCAGVVSTNLVCELCPRKGGLYKKTNVGKWVHHICAVNLSEVTLSQIPKGEWSKQIPKMSHSCKWFNLLHESKSARVRMAKKLTVHNSYKVLICSEMVQSCELKADGVVVPPISFNSKFNNDEDQQTRSKLAMSCQNQQSDGNIDDGISQSNAETLNVPANNENSIIEKRKRPSIAIRIFECTECKTVSHSEFLMVRCNKCKLYYHKICVNPPIEIKYYKTKYSIWMCQSCCDALGTFWNRTMTRLQLRMTTSN